MELNLIRLDSSYSKKEEIQMKKPKSFKELKEFLEQKLNISPEYVDIFSFNEKNEEIRINNENNYKKIKDIIFILEINEEQLVQSSIEINNKDLDESRLNNSSYINICTICTIEIKQENIAKCNKCNKIFHEKCLEKWNKECELKGNPFTCPLCRDETPFEQWEKIRFTKYEIFRNYAINLMRAIKEYIQDNNKKSNIIQMKEKEINELNEIKIKQNELIKKYEDYINKTINIFKNILDQIKNLHNLLKLEENIRLRDLIEKYPLNIKNLDLFDISKIIEEEFDKFDEHLFDINKKDNNKKNKFINFEEEEEIVPNNAIPNDIEEEIIVKYFVKNKGNYNIFGEQFVKNNFHNINLIINDVPNKLVNKYQLNKGENIVKIIVRNELKDLSYMFSSCKYLKNIKGLKYLDVSSIRDFSYMFNECSLLSNINALKNWNVSKGKYFSYMFRDCPKLSNIKALENWNVSKCVNFQGLFLGCESLTDIKSLENWDVSKVSNFQDMFCGCSSLSDINPLKNWNVSNGINFQCMFTKCTILTDLKPLKNWNVSQGIDFQKMFWNCALISDIEPLKNWDVSKGNNFQYMFLGCSSSLDVSPVKNWKVSKELLSNIK